MATIEVDVNDRSRVLEAFYAWRSAEHVSEIVNLPPESAGPGNLIVFSLVPREFLAVLDHEGIPYRAQ